MPAWSGLFNGEHGENYALLHNVTPLRGTLARLMRKRGMAVNRELIDELLGAAAGANTALVNIARKTAEQGQQSAVATIANQTLVNRVTATADITAIEAILNTSFAPSTYPTDASGNAGGGKLGQL